MYTYNMEEFKLDISPLKEDSESSKDIDRKEQLCTSRSEKYLSKILSNCRDLSETHSKLSKKYKHRFKIFSNSHNHTTNDFIKC